MNQARTFQADADASGSPPATLDSLVFGDVLGARIAVADLNSAADALVRSAVDRVGGYVCLCNVHVLVTAQLEPAVAAALRDARCVLADGAPVAWLQRRLGFSSACRVPGPDLMPLVFERAQSLGLRHFLLGSTELVVDALRLNLLHKFPEALVVGSYCPPYDAEIALDAVDRIASAEPHVVWCALGAPKQELWMQRHAGVLGPMLLVGVGAAFDFLAGTKRRAPDWMQRLSLEWLHRLATEPRRLGPRYLHTNVAFLRLSFAALRHERPWAPWAEGGAESDAASS